jgi:PAS domain S-box-containing protein
MAHELMEELQEAERRFVTTMENIEVPCIILDRKTRIAFVNRYVQQITGFHCTELLNHDWFHTLCPVEKAAVDRAILFGCFQRTPQGLTKFDSSIITTIGICIPMRWHIHTLQDCLNQVTHIHLIGEELEQSYYPISPLTPQLTAIPSRIPSRITPNPLLKRYTIEGDIGVGRYAKVKKATDTSTNKEVAIKIVEKRKLATSHEISQARREMDILRHLAPLNHPNVAKMIECVEDDDAFYMVMEYVGGGELSFLSNNGDKRGMDEETVRRIAITLISTIYFCHRNGIVHRDIKPQNILFDEGGNMKLIDFGLADFTTKGKLLCAYCGSFAYCPPEMLLGIPYFGEKVDVWSIAVVLYSLLTCKLPFGSVQQILAGKYEEISADFSPLLQNLLHQMFAVNMEERIGLEEVLNHPWIAQPTVHAPPPTPTSTSTSTPATKPSRRRSLAEAKEVSCTVVSTSVAPPNTQSDHNQHQQPHHQQQQPNKKRKWVKD